MKEKFLKRAAAMLCVSLMLAGCGGTTTDTTTATTKGTVATTAGTTATTEPVTEAPYKLSMIAPAQGTKDFTEDMLEREYVQKAYDAIAEYTNTELDLKIYESGLYYEKIPLLLASNDLPSIMVGGKDATFISAAQNDTFWEVGEFFDDYKNLSEVTETARLNVSVNGKIYAIPRSRAIGRNGAGYRLDWLNNLGMSEIKTIDDLYKMLQAFTNQDPDQDGKNNTYGMIATDYAGPWDILQIWFGAPNKWGFRDGKLTPACMTDEWKEALAWFRKIYSEGLVNPDFATTGSGEWDKMLRSGLGGFSADVVDRFRRNQENMVNNGQPNVEHMIICTLENSRGEKHSMPTDGYNGIIIINKNVHGVATTEKDRDKCLAFMDKLSDAAMLDICEGWFVEGVHWHYTTEGYAEKLSAESYNAGLNQILSYFVAEGESDKRISAKVKPAEVSEIRALETAANEESPQYAVPNMAAGYTSDIETYFGADLTQIITDARIAYIIGEIDDVGLQAEIDRWYTSGGKVLVDDYNRLYEAGKQ